MSHEQLMILLIACVVSSACVLPGVFLVLRRVALMSDAISHAILLGIVLGFFVVHNLHSPFLILAATLTGVLTVTLTELLIQSRRIKKDAAIGLIFPLFFSIGVILINKYAKNVHLDSDAVLLGELAFAPFNQWVVGGTPLGPVSLWVMGGILLLNALFIGFFYKELKIATFDAGLAATLGFSPVLLHYTLMTLVSITCVGAFDAVGSILVVALMITPPATAYLLVPHSLPNMIKASLGLGILASLTGYGLATWLNASIAGCMATMTGIFFSLALTFSPDHGLFIKYLKRKQQKLEFATTMLLVQLLDHEGSTQESQENTISNMNQHMNWDIPFISRIISYAVSHHYINKEGDRLFLTALGRENARFILSK